MLTIFFDGVPKPGSEEKRESRGGEQEKPPGEVASRENAPVMVSHHPDYTAGNCDKCHDRSAANFLKGQRDALCFTCHDNQAFVGRYVHGPVAVKDCMYCHLPHESPYGSLLTKTAAELCLSCHLEADILQNPAHRIRSNTDSSQTLSAGLCTGCHYAHAAGNPYFLKGNPPAPPE